MALHILTAPDALQLAHKRDVARPQAQAHVGGAVAASEHEAGGVALTGGSGAFVPRHLF